MCRGNRTSLVFSTLFFFAIFRVTENDNLAQTFEMCKARTVKPDWSLYLALGTLSIIGLAASLDGTSISPALPV